MDGFIEPVPRQWHDPAEFYAVRNGASEFESMKEEKLLLLRRRQRESEKEVFLQSVDDEIW